MHSALDHSPLDLILDSRAVQGLSGPWYGVYPAIVSQIKDDPTGTGRVKVTLPWSPDTGSDRYEAWARVATMMGGNQRGSWFIPDVNDEVLVSFEGGDPRRPYVLGGLWNGKDAPPQSMDGAGQNNKKVLCSRKGVKITLDDTDGAESFVVETPGNQSITLKDGAGSIEIADSNGNTIELQSSGITLHTSAKITLNATLLEVSASLVTVNSGFSVFSGVVQAQTVICNSIISASYTPGAGNVW
jgi:uncharacterized protein involved in type VI secretion and phage assembly